MTRFLTSISIILFAVSFLLTGSVVLAEDPPSTAPGTPASNVNRAGDANREVKLINPIKGTKEKPVGDVNLAEIVGIIIKSGLGIIGSVTFVVFIYGGLQWLLSRGNSEMITKGLDTMVYAAIGLCIIFASYAILRTIFIGLENVAK